jgi:hypothetical protein
MQRSIVYSLAAGPPPVIRAHTPLPTPPPRQTLVAQLVPDAASVLNSNGAYADVVV